MRTLEPVPQALVLDGKTQFGTFSSPMPLVNPTDADAFEGVPFSKRWQHLRLKEWQAFQIGSPRYFVNVALFNAKALALVQVKLFDRVSKTKVLYERKVTPWSFALPTNMLDSVASYRSRGCSVTFRNQWAKDRVEVHLDIAKTKSSPEIWGTFVGDTEGCTPLVVSQPFAKNRGMYSQKGLFRARGDLQIDGKPVIFGEDESYCLMDDHKGFYPFEMKWDWVTSAKRLEDGQLMGFNLTKNQCIDPEAYNENCLWIGDKVHLLPPVVFNRKTGSPEVWEIRDTQGRVKVDFEVQVPGPVDINAVVIRSKYRGPFGTFSGTLVDDEGTAHKVDGMFGMGEDFYLRC